MQTISPVAPLPLQVQCLPAPHWLLSAHLPETQCSYRKGKKTRVSLCKQLTIKNMQNCGFQEGITYNSTRIISATDVRLALLWAVVTRLANSGGSVADIVATLEKIVFNLDWSCKSKREENSNESEVLDAFHFELVGLERQKNGCCEFRLIDWIDLLGLELLME